LIVGPVFVREGCTKIGLARAIAIGRTTDTAKRPEFRSTNGQASGLGISPGSLTIRVGGAGSTQVDASIHTKQGCILTRQINQLATKARFTGVDTGCTTSFAIGRGDTKGTQTLSVLVARTGGRFTRLRITGNGDTIVLAWVSIILARDDLNIRSCCSLITLRPGINREWLTIGTAARTRKSENQNYPEYQGFGSG
jgi:hypothetical protein